MLLMLPRMRGRQQVVVQLRGRVIALLGHLQLRLAHKRLLLPTITAVLILPQ